MSNADGFDRRIFLIGGSSGAIDALGKLLSSLPSNFPAPILAVIHMHPDSRFLLPRILQRDCKLIVQDARDGLEPRPRHVYVAPPNCHLILQPGRMRLIGGPTENRCRPAIDPLFRTASEAYGPACVGIVLSGYLDDGSIGLFHIKQAGGTAIVQDPEDAAVPDMPHSAIDRIVPDFVAPVADIPEIMVRLANEPIKQRSRISSPEVTPMVPKSNQQPGTPAVFTCPECHGTLWESEEGGALKFRCRVGHSFTADSMFSEQRLDLERAIWAALRVLEEHEELSNRLAKRARHSGHSHAERRYMERAQESHINAKVLRDLLNRTQPEAYPAASPARDATAG